MGTDAVTEFQKSRRAVFARDFYNLPNREGFSGKSGEIIMNESEERIEVMINLPYAVSKESITIVDGTSYLIVSARGLSGNQYAKIINIPHTQKKTGISHQVKGNLLIITILKGDK